MKPTLASYKCNSHSAFYCKKYPALKNHWQQCRAAGLCIYSLSPVHNTEQCPGKICCLYSCWKYKICEHVDTLCPDLEKSQVDTNPCLQMGEMNLLLPIVQVTIVSSLNELELCVKLPNFECSVPFLFDECLDLQFHVKGLSAAVRNIIAGGSKLAFDFSYVRNDCLSVH